MVRLVYGVGLNDADYVTQIFETILCVGGKKKKKLTWRCPYYQAWKDMLGRCCCIKFQERNPTYKDCSVIDKWHTFSEFKSWMERQDWEGKQLDKDLLFPGNKIYSPVTCAFVDQTTNKFMNDNGRAKGRWPLGVSWHKASGKFQANCNNPFTHKFEYLGLFNCPDKAHLTWKSRKHELACLLADQQTDPRVAEALRARYL